MNPVEIIRGLNTPKDWATFVLGLIAGVVLTGTAAMGLKNVLNLDLVAKGSYYTPEQINTLFVPNQVVSQFYLKKEDVSAYYIHKSELERNYFPVSSLQERCGAKTDSATLATQAPVNMTKYMLRSDLANYISREDLRRSYVSKGACDQEILNRRVINETHTLKPGDRVDLPLAGILVVAFAASRDSYFDRNYPPYLQVSRIGEKDPATYSETHFERYEYNNRRFTFRILSVAKGGVFRVSLTEDR